MSDSGTWPDPPTSGPGAFVRRQVSVLTPEAVQPKVLIRLTGYLTAERTLCRLASGTREEESVASRIGWSRRTVSGRN